MLVAAEAGITEALIAPTTTAGTSKDFQRITSSPRMVAAEFFFYFDIVGMEGYVVVPHRIPSAAWPGLSRRAI
jgi:hypothetical protein